MKLATLLKITVGIVSISYALIIRFSPQTLVQFASRSEPDFPGVSEHYTLEPDSIYDGDTFSVSDGSQEMKVRLCGIDSPEMDQTSHSS